jgi:hypothetical protein
VEHRPPESHGFRQLMDLALTEPRAAIKESWLRLAKAILRCERFRR